MRLIFGQDQEISRWVASQIPHLNGGDFGPCQAIGVVDANGVPAAGIVYHAYQPQYGNISMSFAATNKAWLTRRIATSLLKYPFEQLHVARVTAITPSDPRTSVWQFLTRFGFQKEGRVRKGLGTDDAVIWGLLASEWATNRFNTERRVEKKRPKGTLRLERPAFH